MVNTVGRVDFRARLDGRGTERDAENIGRGAGEAAGKGLDAEFSKAFRKTLSDSGKRSFDSWKKSGMDDGGVYGKTFTDRLVKATDDGLKALRGIRLDTGFLDDFARGYKDIDQAVADLDLQLSALNGRVNNNTLQAAKRQVDEWAKSTREASEAAEALAESVRRETEASERSARANAEHTQARDNLIASIREHNAVALRQSSIWQESESSADGLNRRVQALAESSGDLSFQWKDLSHNTRQWTLIIGAVLAGMQDIAVLGSAAGAGLLAIGGAATSGLIGLGGTAAVFVTLNKELDELPEHLRPVAAEFKAFTPVFSELREAVSSGAFRQMPGVFDSLGDSLRSLTPDLDALGVSIGDTFGDLATAIRPGSAALDEIRRSIALAGPNFRTLANAAGDMGVALLRSFNEAQPLVSSLIGYVQRLANQFDAFSRSDNFSLWMANAESVFSSLGPLVDATARALNDLVTPASVQRTTAFLDNLTAFMPNLTRMLDVLGRLDLFGLAAQLLNDFGAALEPLAGPVGDLAEALNGLLSIAIAQVADALGILATAIAPTVQGLADFVSALPPDVVAGLANTVLVLAGAFVVLKGAAGVAGAVTALSTMGATFDTTAGKAGRLGNALSGALGKAGLVGLAIGGALLLTDGIKALAREIDGTDDKVRNLVATNSSLKDSYNELNGVADGLVAPLTNTKAVLDDLARVGNPFENFALAFSETGAQALALSGTLGELDVEIASLAMNNLPQAQEQFAGWATEMGASGSQIMTLLEQMPGFKEALIQQAEVLGIAATDQNLMNLAMGEGVGANAAITEAYGSTTTAAGLSAEAISDLSDKIRTSSETAYGARDAARSYYEQIEELTGAIAENGATLDITTEAGRNNQQAVDDLAQAVLDHSASTLEDTGSMRDSNQVMADGRAKLVEMLQQFGLTAAEASRYADELGLIPSDIYTVANLDVSRAEGAIRGFINRWDGSRITVYADGSMSMGNGAQRFMASGGILNQATHVIAGEAGREAFVPLDRPLSQVDPSVRWLAAIAQGKGGPQHMASGGIAGGGRNVTIEAGAIVVYDSGDPGATANEALRQIAERLNG